MLAAMACGAAASGRWRSSHSAAAQWAAWVHSALGSSREHGERQALDGGIVGQRHGGGLPPARARGKRLRGDRPQASG
jgi:hypothetical protein